MNGAIRDLLSQADHERSIAAWAESMRGTIRLGRPVKVSEMHQRGPFGRKGKYLYELDDRMPADGVDALYRALGIVRDEAHARADSLEAKVTIASPADGSAGGQ